MSPDVHLLVRSVDVSDTPLDSWHIACCRNLVAPTLTLEKDKATCKQCLDALLSDDEWERKMRQSR